MDRHGPPGCPACRGRACRGGGNLDCVQREDEVSYIGAVLDTYGGLDVVVATFDNLKTYARPDEVLIIVADESKRIHMPIAWHDIPVVVAIAKLAVEGWLQRGLPNEPYAREAATMYQLRCLEQNQRSLDLSAIAET